MVANWWLRHFCLKGQHVFVRKTPDLSAAIDNNHYLLIFQEVTALFQLTPYVGLFETDDKVTVNMVKSHLNHDAYKICNLCLGPRDPQLMMISSASFH